jgi:hypothetical protein
MIPSSHENGLVDSGYTSVYIAVSAQMYTFAVRVMTARLEEVLS